MICSAIVAMGPNREIGKANGLLWQLPADLKHFRQLTIGKPIIMGRKTFESIGRPLPDRTNIILTSDPNFTATGCVVVHSLDEALAAAEGASEVMVIGGGQIYEQFLPRIERLYITEVAGDFPADVFFPALDPNDWHEVSREAHPSDEKNPHPYTFVVLERNEAYKP